MARDFVLNSYRGSVAEAKDAMSFTFRCDPPLELLPAGGLMALKRLKLEYGGIKIPIPFYMEVRSSRQHEWEVVQTLLHVATLKDLVQQVNAAIATQTRLDNRAPHFEERAVGEETRVSRIRYLGNRCMTRRLNREVRDIFRIEESYFPLQNPRGTGTRERERKSQLSRRIV